MEPKKVVSRKTTPARNCNQCKAVDRQTDLSFLLKDFEKSFDMYMYSHKERVEAMKMCLVTAATPIIFASTLGVTGELNFSPFSIDTISKWPGYIFIIAFFSSFAGWIPLHIFASAHSNTYKMIRYMNGYRLFYYQNIAPEIKNIKWKSAIEKDPRYPTPSITDFLHWTVIFMYAMLVLNTALLVFGAYFLGQGYLVTGVLGVLSAVIQFLLIKSEIHSKDVSSIDGNSVDNLLKNLNS